ncbi:LysR family transcriptional regulator [Pseudoalteromonas obscura]|uniref:LysR family transcriptional regulator n=1 Tax=Pseudoalteromonas obscura TaxID=3048491 RepID=A0ABT7EJQ0_9GAMM|nr:LysR family transcriptional regulator [Pseudoalteromonas sp. P94(2023)]MDK2595275.1 LysR family transcriptional regulator [Pseudoalteromonas sp. P94(2023)]
MNEHKRIELLLLFVKLAEELSYTKAAHALGISKGQLSEKIKRFEQVLNTPLLVRTTRNVKLTQYGVQVYEQGKLIRAQLFELERSINNDEISGVIRITAPRMFAQVYLSEICCEFKKRYNDIEFEIDASYRTHNLNVKDYDVAFRATVSPPQDMVAIKLFDYQHIIAASPNYLSETDTLSTPLDLANHTCIVVNQQKQWPFKEQSIPVTGWLSTNDNNLVKQYALQNVGLIRIADYFVKQELKTGRLISVLDEFIEKHSNGMYLFYPQTSQPAHKLRTFIQFVRAYFEQTNYDNKN